MTRDPDPDPYAPHDADGPPRSSDGRGSPGSDLVLIVVVLLGLLVFGWALSYFGSALVGQ